VPSSSNLGVLEASPISSVPPGAPLGTIGNFAATPNLSDIEAAVRNYSLRERFELQKVARRLVPWHGIRRCLRAPVPMAQNVELHYQPEHKRGRFRQLQLCKSPWACPCCAAHITEERRRDLQKLDKAARLQGLRVALVTLTFSHRRSDDLEAILAAFLEALRKLTAQRSYKMLRQVAGLIGWIRALEVTHGVLNGWHPHAHLLCFVAGDLPLAEFSSSFAREWQAALAKVGLSCDLEHGCRVDDTNARIAEYISKYGREPRWDEAAELTKAHVKHGRQQSRTPFDLLRAARDGDKQAGLLFVEFVRVFKGRCQLQPTPYLTKMIGGDEWRSDEELADAGEGSTVLLALLAVSGWRKVVRQDARAELLSAMDTGGIGQVMEVLDALGVVLGEVVLPSGLCGTG
jgi:hypothetical protein